MEVFALRGRPRRGRCETSFVPRVQFAAVPGSCRVPSGSSALVAISDGVLRRSTHSRAFRLAFSLFALQSRSDRRPRVRVPVRVGFLLRDAERSSWAGVPRLQQSGRRVLRRILRFCARESQPPPVHGATQQNERRDLMGGWGL